MDFLALVLISVGLAMDAFAVSVCKGLAMKRPDLKSITIVGLWFGVFQGVMPVIGFYMGTALYDLVEDYAPWVAFVLLAAIGGNMIFESLSKKEEELGYLDSMVLTRSFYDNETFLFFKKKFC